MPSILSLSSSSDTSSDSDTEGSTSSSSSSSDATSDSDTEESKPRNRKRKLVVKKQNKKERKKRKKRRKEREQKKKKKKHIAKKTKQQLKRSQFHHTAQVLQQAELQHWGTRSAIGGIVGAAIGGAATGGLVGMLVGAAIGDQLGREPVSKQKRQRQAPHDYDKHVSKYWVPPKRRTHGDTVRVLYHITSHGPEIKRSKILRRGSAGAVGGGIYFADTQEACRKKAHSKGWVIKAKVLVGKSKNIEIGFFASLMNQYSFNSLHREGYDSLRVSGFNSGAEYVVYNSDQVQILSVDEQASECVVM